MINPAIELQTVGPNDRNRVGGKGFSLAQLKRGGILVPNAILITSDTYASYVSSTGLREQILLELSRKDFQDMRWEEMWDASLRIRNMFLKTAIPPELVAQLKRVIASGFKSSAVVVRSSALDEDSGIASFAGLHESYVNVRGIDSILDHIRLVWASLWSDRALLYRQELRLDVERSAMAVVVQELVEGEKSGVVFGKHPMDESQAVIEAVYGLNQGLVDGIVEPDRWVLDRKTRKLVSHATATRNKALVTSREGVSLEPLPAGKLSGAPLNSEEVTEVFLLAFRAEEIFGSPQDVEWTFRQGALYALQSRPITTASPDQRDDKRPWYLSLRRSFENLKALREKIEHDLIPRMVREANALAERDPKALADSELAEEIARRSSIHKRWTDVYWTEFIPFAHGARLFGQVYNDVMRPSDPYEFVDLLRGSELASVERNRMLEEMAASLRADHALAEELRNEDYARCDEDFVRKIEDFLEKFGNIFVGTGSPQQGRKALIKLLLEMTDRGRAKSQSRSGSITLLEENFLSQFEGDQRTYAVELLELGRASYRLRDDDNIYLGRIEAQLFLALQEGKSRIGTRSGIDAANIDAQEVIKALTDVGYTPVSGDAAPPKTKRGFQLTARQILGQPAGPGIATGKARVIAHLSDLMDFRAGEVLVCDALDPNMTFVVPLAAGIVERRGGMLIHGAIIAREYGLPCVTGVTDATLLIQTGDQLTVDGYLGIVIISRENGSSNL
ncbi:MAG: hypothetical protein C4532_16865 [Candidatus Abyssobacteria bacterium SURF_17]|uniref:Phosphoenolpyruvate synthase n=1 Tax=Candidatus Abyssobacteria bacterium SURF_17 TaxID=2093361 RepID=A0A419ER52_9BACT|nr:MAG: hypothetical protein C4532_16865 [Candidatus Abyssubacteria bacterium SURF_17]